MLDGRLIQCGIKYSNHANKGDWEGGLDQLQQLDTHAQTKGWEIREGKWCEKCSRTCMIGLPASASTRPNIRPNVCTIGR